VKLSFLISLSLYFAPFRCRNYNYCIVFSYALLTASYGFYSWQLCPFNRFHLSAYTILNSNKHHLLPSSHPWGSLIQHTHTHTHTNEIFHSCIVLSIANRCVTSWMSRLLQVGQIFCTLRNIYSHPTSC
jgi:hypothetical protein